MRKTKAKRGSFWQDRMLPFVIVWAMCIGAVSFISRLWLTVRRVFSIIPEDKVALSVLTGTVLTGVIQIVLVERLLKKPMHRWMLYTISGALITWGLSDLVADLFFGSMSFLSTIFDYRLLANLALNVPTVLLQYVWLRHRVKYAWLWPLMSIPLLMAFTAISYGAAHYQFVRLVMLLCSGVVQAGLMHYFWQHTEEPDKTKNDHAQRYEDGRIERLQEHEHSNPLWDRGDDHALQNEA